MAKFELTITETGKKIYVTAAELKRLVKRGAVSVWLSQEEKEDWVKKGVVFCEGKEKQNC